MKMRLNVFQDTDLGLKDLQALVAQYLQLVEDETGNPFSTRSHDAIVGRSWRCLCELDRSARHYLSAVE